MILTEEDWELVLATAAAAGSLLVVLLGPFVVAFLCWYVGHRTDSEGKR